MMLEEEVSPRESTQIKGRDNFFRHSKLKIATPQELARITPWVQLETQEIPSGSKRIGRANPR